MFVIFGYLSGLFSLLVEIVYIRHVLQHKAKPHRGTFLIWSILTGIAFFSQLAKGATSSLWLPGISTIGTTCIFFLSLKYGIGGFTRQDRIALLLACSGLIAWYLTREPAIALYITIFVDAIGTYLTMHKAYRMPESEKPAAWIISACSGLFAFLSVGKFDIVLLSYPFYIILADSAVLFALELGKKKKK